MEANQFDKRVLPPRAALLAPLAAPRRMGTRARHGSDYGLKSTWMTQTARMDACPPGFNCPAHGESGGLGCAEGGGDGRQSRSAALLAVAGSLARPLRTGLQTGSAQTGEGGGGSCEARMLGYSDVAYRMFTLSIGDNLSDLVLLSSPVQVPQPRLPGPRAPHGCAMLG